MVTLLHAPYHLMLINSSILLLISHKSAQASHTAKRHDSSSRDNWDITPSSGDGLCPGRATGQETLLRHQETACVQGEPQAKRPYSVIRRRPVSRESHRPRDITPSSGDGLCPGRATGQETLLRHQETACVQGEPQAKRPYSVIRRRPVSRESHRPRDITPSSGDGLCPGRATGQETLLRHRETACVQGEPQAKRPYSQETACVQGEPQAKRPYSVIRRRPVSRESHRPRDITPSSGDGLCPGRATGQETLLRHQETACVQGEPQAKRHYSVIGRRPVSRESHRPRDITPSSGDGLCPGRATGQETLLRHQETACVQGEPQAKRPYSVIRRRPVSRESHRPRDLTPSSGDGLCPGRATGQETLLRHQETACVQGEPQAISMSFKTLNRTFSKSTPSTNPSHLSWTV